MIVKRLEDVIGTKGDAHGDKWHSLRLLHTEDGMGVTLTDSVLEAGFEMVLWQKNHLDACYCLEGADAEPSARCSESGCDQERFELGFGAEPLGYRSDPFLCFPN